MTEHAVGVADYTTSNDIETSLLLGIFCDALYSVQLVQFSNVYILYKYTAQNHTDITHGGGGGGGCAIHHITTESKHESYHE